MTVSSTIRKAGPFAGNNAATTFPFSFKVFAKGDVKVLLVNLNGLATTLTLDSDYSVLLNANQDANPGGWVTYPISGSPLATGYELVMLGDLPYDQETDITNQGGFYPSVIEDMSDRSTIQIQQLAEIASRAIVYSEAESVSPVLPNALARANSLVGFDASGNLELFGLSPAVGAGDLRNEAWTNGQDFTAETSNSVTLSRAYGTKANLGTVVMSGVAQDPSSYSLTNSGTTLLFDSIIPAGVTRIWCVGGTTLSIYIPPAGSVTEAMLAVGSRMASRVRDFVSLTDYLCLYDGSDETTKVQAAITAIGANAVTLLVPGNVKISGNLTFGANTELQFSQGGLITGTSGTEVVQVQKQILAGPRRIFANCAPISTVGQEVYPEWFGAARDGATTDKAAFNLAYGFLKNTGGAIYMWPGVYALDGGITNCQSHVALYGAGQNITQLKVTTPNADAIDCIGTPGAFINNPVFQGFNIISATPGTTGGAGLNLQYTTLTKCTDIQVIDFLNGISMTRATNTFHTRIGASYSGSANNFIGFNIFGGGTGAGGNASSVFRDCYVDGSASSGTGKTAYHCYGAYVSDLYFSNCASASCDYGWSLDYSTATAGGYADVIIHNPVIDNYTLQGILVNAMLAQQMLTIIGGWINPKGTAAETDGIYVTGCAGQVTVTGTQISGENNYANAVGVRVIGSKGVKVSGCTFEDNNYHIRESGSSLCVYSGNSMTNQAAHPATSHINIIGSTRSMCTGNTHDGYAANTVVADNTSTGVGVTCSVFNAATLSAPRVSNLSGGPIGASDGSLGLNSGV